MNRFIQQKQYFKNYILKNKTKKKIKLKIEFSKFKKKDKLTAMSLGMTVNHIPFLVAYRMGG